MEVLGIIGARSGSKGLPGKNARHLAGRPLLAWPIATAKRCRLITRVILSTDSEQYAAIGRQCGAEVPFLRPPELSSDSATDLQFILHALAWLADNEGYRPDFVVRLYATSPLVRAPDIDRAVELLASNDGADSTILMTEAREHPAKAARIAADGLHAVSYLTGHGLDLSPSLRQAHPDAYNRQGLPVVTRVDSLRNLQSQTGHTILFHLVPQSTAIDIDTELDFAVAEVLAAREASREPA
jgi:CMP-N-acetylneuraminic acid synthetase